MVDFGRISPEEFVIKLGRKSQIFSRFKQLIHEKIATDSFKTTLSLWNKYFGYLDKYIESEIVKSDFFIGLSYAMWVFFHLSRQIEEKIDISTHLPFNTEPFQYLLDVPFMGVNSLSNELEDQDISYKNFSDQDMFAPFLSDLLSLDTLEEKGMFFTPNFMAHSLIEQIARNRTEPLGKAPVIDPTCGTGVFLQEYLKYCLKNDRTHNIAVDFLQKMYGIDENPAALFATFLNLWLIIERKCNVKDINHRKRILQIFQKNFRCTDILAKFDNPEKFPHFPSFSIAFGNLPWNVLNNIRSVSIRQSLLSLSNFFKIGMTWKNQSNLEIATIFWEIIRTNLVKTGGIMAFILPASLLTGSQHAKFRRFTGMRGIQAFQIFPDFFPVHSMFLICKINHTRLNKDLSDHLKFIPKNINAFKIIFQNSNDIKESQSYARPYELIPLGNFAPSFFKIYRNQPLVGKYEFTRTKASQIPVSPSKYASEVHRGVDITPRQLLFVQTSIKLNEYTVLGNETKMKENLISISPVSQKYNSTHSNRWKNVKFSPTMVELEYIYPVIKSTDLIPFHIQAIHKAFLPIKLERNKYSLQEENTLPSFAKKHFKKISHIYHQNHNPKGKNHTISENLSYGGKLSNPALTSPLKVIYPVGGSYAKAAIIRNPNWITDVTFYYLTPENEDEAYYLLAWLNSEILNRNLHRVCTVGANGSIRVIHLAPWQFPLPKFQNHSNMQKISLLGRKLEHRALELYEKNGINTQLPQNIERKGASLSKIYKILRNDTIYRELQSKLTELFQKLIIGQ